MRCVRIRTGRKLRVQRCPMCAATRRAAPAQSSAPPGLFGHFAQQFGCEAFRNKYDRQVCASVGNFGLLSGSGDTACSWMGLEMDLRLAKDLWHAAKVEIGSSTHARADRCEGVAEGIVRDC